ncbi:biotin/lipoyl-containing protein, partial [Klebsiella pneumoniae]
RHLATVTSFFDQYRSLGAVKMETEIRAAQAGTVRGIAVKAGDAVAVGDTLMTLA